jgi:ABC-type Na+ efflux pump permease subunit
VRPRKLLRIARWEVTKNAGGIDRRTLAVVVISVALFGLVTPLIAGGGASLGDGLYRVSVDESSPYYDVVESESAFVIRDGGSDALEDGDIELLIEGEVIQYRETPKGLAAYEELQDSIQRYNNRNLRLEANQTAAFPVTVLLEYQKRSGVDTIRVGDQSDDGTGGDGTGGDGTGGEGTGSDGTGGDGTGSDGTGTGGDGTGGDAQSGEQTVDSDGGSGFGGISSPLSQDRVSGSPADISPPFPFQSLVLAFVFVIPLNFLIQAYGSTILSERINRRGELLLVSPVSRLDIIGGKTLPYFLGGMILETIIAVGLFALGHGKLGGGISVLAVMPLVLLFLGATFLGAMFARSFKELTFITVTITVTLTSYAFVPAIFTDVGAIALISPLTLVVRDLQNEAISVGAFVFSTTPPLLCSFVFFGLGSGLYREEDMFDQRSLRGRVLDSLAGPISRPYHVGVMTAVLIPFVFVIQLMAIALLFALGEISIVLILVVVAVVEEIAKSLHIYAAYEHRRFDTGLRTALLLGLASGVGFFVAEKIALLGQLVGLPELAIGEAGLQGGIIAGPILILFLLAPLALHVVTAAISAVGASRGKRAYIGALSVAMLIHLTYNWTIVEVMSLV